MRLSTHCSTVTVWQSALLRRSCARSVVEREREWVAYCVRPGNVCLAFLSLNDTCLSLESLRSFWTVSFGIQKTISVSSICCVLACIFSPVCCCCTLPAGPRSFARWPASHRSQGYMTCLSITKQATFDYGSTIIKHASSVTTLENFTRRLVDDISNVVAAIHSLLGLGFAPPCW